jgi:hypothetical protein
MRVSHFPWYGAGRAMYWHNFAESRVGSALTRPTTGAPGVLQPALTGAGAKTVTPGPRAAAQAG